MSRGLAGAILVWASVAHADQRVDVVTGAVIEETSGNSGLVNAYAACPTQATELPALGWKGDDWVLVKDRAGKELARHRLRSVSSAGGLQWLVASGGVVVIAAAMTGEEVDRVFAFDRSSGKLLWTRDDLREMRSGADLPGERLVIAGQDKVLLLDGRRGTTLATAAAPGVESLGGICRSVDGYHLIQTGLQLIVFDAKRDALVWTGTMQGGTALAIHGRVVDGWVDGRAHRFGVTIYSLASGKVERRVDLGSTGGKYDVSSVILYPIGSTEVRVHSEFGVE
jgi:hypothetical protein